MSSQISSQVSDGFTCAKRWIISARMQEEEQEARFKKLDETIRTLQKARQEAAIRFFDGRKKSKKKKRFFKR